MRGLVLGDLVVRGERGGVGQRLQDGVDRGMPGAAPGFAAAVGPVVGGQVLAVGLVLPLLVLRRGLLLRALGCVVWGCVVWGCGVAGG